MRFLILRQGRPIRCAVLSWGRPTRWSCDVRYGHRGGSARDSMSGRGKGLPLQCVVLRWGALAGGAADGSGDAGGDGTHASRGEGEGLSRTRDLKDLRNARP
eukprot:3932050-Rhodomonas_salina.2